VTATVPLSAYLILSAALFAIGVIGVVIRRNALIIFMAIELMLNAVNLTFVAFSKFLGSMDGQIIVLFVMAVAAAEVALGLAIIIALYRNKESVNVDDINLLRG
jgi:NADH-quinone oxidoreductase subunit K